ncbi:MAG: ABC transporter permease [Chloroflexaceae bacterium]|nr:ABC transporter permease [Chloroflexaceae bacterium]
MLARIWAIAANGFREVLRDRILYVIGFFGALFLFAVTFIPKIALDAEGQILPNLGLGAIALLSTIVAIFVGAGLINKEIDKRTVLVLIAKPISRAELIIGKHLGLFGVLLILVFILSVLCFGLLSAFGVDYPLGSFALAQVYLCLELLLLIAAALAFGAFTSSILATLLSFGVFLMGHVSQDLLELGKISQNPGIERLTRGLYLVLPDLSRLNLRNDAVYNLLPSGGELISSALYALVYTIMLLGIAIFIFSQREF